MTDFEGHCGKTKEIWNDWNKNLKSSLVRMIHIQYSSCFLPHLLPRASTAPSIPTPMTCSWALVGSKSFMPVAGPHLPHLWHSPRKRNKGSLWVSQVGRKERRTPVKNYWLWYHLFWAEPGFSLNNTTCFSECLPSPTWLTAYFQTRFFLCVFFNSVSPQKFLQSLSPGK